uniref:Apple domain-containing protein n=1 Tax=Daphnia galeata TaxID=27404 RepID=A0A8J2RL36_9CRUS|nr:unnamed protein product [Daphnia galeata]
MEVWSVILMIFLLISVVSMTSVSARDWEEGDYGQVRWDSYCRYTGHYISYKHSSDRQCGRVCLSNSRCTHFTQGNGVCYIVDMECLSMMAGHLGGFVITFPIVRLMVNSSTIFYHLDFTLFMELLARIYASFIHGMRKEFLYLVAPNTFSSIN